MHKERDYTGLVLAKGLLRNKEKHRLFRAASPRFANNFPTVPGDWDLRKKTAPCENQGSCGSCWAFSQTNALRSAKMLAGHDTGPLSKNFLLLNQGTHREWGCNGGDFNAGLNMLNGRGPCLETESPYRATTWGVRYPRGVAVAATASQWVVVGSGDRPTAQELCVALWNGGVGADLSVDIAADGAFSRYSSGVITRSTSFVINHMVRFVGFNAGASVNGAGEALFSSDGSWADPRGAYFIGRNNWTSQWGVDGDFMIAYGVNNVAETAMMYIL